MKYLLKITFIMTILIALYACGESQQQKDLLIGRWEASEVNQAGLAASFTLTFNEDDTGEYIMVMHHPKFGDVETRFTYTYMVSSKYVIITMEELYLDELLAPMRETLKNELSKTAANITDLEYGEINVPSNSYGMINYTKSQ